VVEQTLLHLLLHPEALAFLVELNPVAEPRMAGFFQDLALKVLKGGNSIAGGFLLVPRGHVGRKADHFHQGREFLI
jgi:hypothetical protein